MILVEEKMTNKPILRKARIGDVLQMQTLIMDYANKGMMLPKPLMALYEHLRDYNVVECDGKIVATGALHILWHDLAEVRSLAVAADYKGQGLGVMLLKRLEDEAKELGMPQVFALTYQREFFTRHGYTVIEHRELPQKVWMECVNCPKFPDCDEQAVIKIFDRNQTLKPLKQ